MKEGKRERGEHLERPDELVHGQFQAKKKGGRPRVSVDYDLVRKVMQFGLRQEDVAAIAGVSVPVLSSALVERYGKSFRELKKERLAPVKLTLTQKAIQMAKSGDRTMLIFCLKNLAGWQDKPEPEMDFDDEDIYPLEVEYKKLKEGE
jgi:hypothetical protein